MGANVITKSVGFFSATGSAGTTTGSGSKTGKDLNGTSETRIPDDEMGINFDWSAASAVSATCLVLDTFVTLMFGGRVTAFLQGPNRCP